MPNPGTEESPLRVAVVGSGPTGFYTAQHLFNEKDLNVRVDDHQIVYCTGAQTDRRLGIPGEDLAGSYTATEFVAWYNGHPDYVNHEFDLSQEAAVVVGIGNVAVDVARVLCRTPDELAQTDIADYALEALRESNVKRVYMLGRRGPAQAAFTNAEVKELGELPGAGCTVRAEDMQLDDVTKSQLEEKPDKMTARKLDILNGLVDRDEPDKEKRLDIRFLESPIEILGDDAGRVKQVRVVRNELFLDGGRVKCRPIGREEVLDAGLVFRSVGYRGIPLPGVPFREDWALIPNDKGRVLDAPDGSPLTGEYCAGWIKRGPQGVIGTNKPDALETVRCMLEDFAAGKLLEPEAPADAVEAFVRERQPDCFSYEDWCKLDELEVGKGEPQGRPRVKYTDVGKMLEAIGR
jgi:ferredoxin--NADP+ reductase